MKRFSQTLRVLLALLVATFGTSVVPTAAVYAMDGEEPPVVEKQIETDTVADQTESTVVDDEDATDETGTTPSEPTDITTDEDDATKTDDEDVEVDEKDSSESMVQTLLSPDTTQRQFSAVEVEAPVKNVPFCHATPPEDAKNGWNKLDTAVEVVFKNGHDSRHAKDIIPPFYYEKQGETLYFEGLNWDEKGQAIFENDCVDDSVVIEEPFLQTYHDATVCGQISITLRNVSAWIYPVSYSTDGTEPNANGPKYGPVVDNRTDTNGDGKLDLNGPIKDVSGTKILVFEEDENGGTVTVKYVVAAGSEDELYKNLPVGQVTTVVIDTDCKDTPVTPTAPYVKDLCYDDRDGIFIGYTKGVKYYVDGEKVHGWTWVPFTGTPIEVNAEAREGYEIPEGTVASWTFDSKRFSDKQCLTITKSAKVASDINLDGIINVGDTVTWTITVTNTSDEDYEAFKVKVDDPNATLEGKGYIKYLGAGKSKTLTATSTITASDLAACKVVNAANFSGWRFGYVPHSDNNDDRRVVSPEREGGWTMPAPLATGSATAVYNLYCPEEEDDQPGQVLGATAPTQHVLATATTIPEVLPATGASPQETNYLLLGVVLSAAAYYVAYRRQLAY